MNQAEASLTPAGSSLPMRNGVGASCVSLPAGPWPTLLDFFVERFPGVARDEWLRRMAAGDVCDGEGQPVTAGERHRPGQRLHYYRHLPAEPRIPFEATVLHQDDGLVVADKPHFLPVMPAGRYLTETLLVRLRQQLGIDSLTPAHRIDRETAGLVLFIVQPTQRGLYQTLFTEHRVEKTYEAIAPMHTTLRFPYRHRSRLVESDNFMRMHEVDGEPNSETLIDCIEQRGSLARYRLQPITGRKHQLRAHMAALGMPIVGDAIYPAHQPQPGTPDYSQPLKLLARQLAFDDPITGERRRFESALRVDF